MGSSIGFRPEPQYETLFENSTRSKNQIINTALGVYLRFLHGELTDTKAIAEGREQFDCLYDMPTLDEKAVMTCPVKSEFPSLCAEEKLEDLLSCCRQCPRKAEYLKLVDLKAKYPSAFKDQQEETVTVPTTDTPQERRESSAMVKAAAQVTKKEGWQSTCWRCGQTVYYLKSVKSSRGKYIPLDNLEERKTHNCPNYQPHQQAPAPAVTSIRNQLRTWERRICDCGIWHTDKAEMEKHMLEVHKRKLTTYEAQEAQI